jgi:hypothetical protein
LEEEYNSVAVAPSWSKASNRKGTQTYPGPSNTHYTSIRYRVKDYKALTRPADRHDEISSLIPSKISSTECCRFSKTLQFRSFQIFQYTSITTVSKSRLKFFGALFLTGSHHSPVLVKLGLGMGKSATTQDLM